MTTNEERAAVLARALRAGIDRDTAAVEACCTDDVRAWTPSLYASSLVELVEQLARRDDAFSDLQLDVVPLDVGGDFACVEWSVDMTHTGELVLGDGSRVAPTGLRVTARGASVAEFRDARICSLRQYWDEQSVLEQLGLLVPPDEA